MSEYFDEYARHMIDTEFYAQQKEADFADFMKRLRNRVHSVLMDHLAISSKSDYKKVAQMCDEIIEDEVDDYIDELNEERQEQSEKERSYLDKLFKAALGLSLVSSLLSQKKLMEAPYNSIDTVESFGETLKANAKKAVRTPLMSSYIFGASTATTAGAIEDSLKRLEKGGKSDVHTIISSTQRNVTRLLVPKRDEVHWQYVSMLDDKTCTVCAANSGKTFRYITDVTPVPIHNRCRCYYLPVTRVEDEPTYEEWLKAQPDSIQYKILGPSRYMLFKSGISITKFTSDGHKLTLEELYNSL